MAKYQPVTEVDEVDETDDVSSVDSSGILIGISPVLAGSFIVAEIAGAGILALPKALSTLGYPGLILFSLVGVVMLYAGILLGRCWLRVYGLKRGDEPVRDPYPAIAEAAYGKFARSAVMLLLIIHCFFVAAIYIIMPAQMISKMLHVHIPGLSEVNSVRLWSFFFALIITPLTWLESPKDNWFVAVLGSASTILSVICIIVGFCFLKVSNWAQLVRRNGLTSSKYPVQAFAVSLGIFISAFTGGVIFPTIQTDMKKPSKFSTALVLGYLGCAALYVPVMIGGEVIFDGQVNDNVLLSMIDAFDMSSNPKVLKILVYTGVSSFLFHFVAGAVIQSNPINQLIESYIEMPEGCSFRRCLTRSGFMCIVVLMAVLVPNFTPILSFLGGTVNMFLSIIFPIAFYVGLNPEAKYGEKLAIYLIIVFGLFFAGLIGYINAVGMYKAAFTR